MNLNYLIYSFLASITETSIRHVTRCFTYDNRGIQIRGGFKKNDKKKYCKADYVHSSVQQEESKFFYRGQKKFF